MIKLQIPLLIMAERDEPIFQDLKAGVENQGATEIESLCVNCFENVS